MWAHYFCSLLQRLYPQDGATSFMHGISTPLSTGRQAGGTQHVSSSDGCVRRADFLPGHRHGRGWQANPVPVILGCSQALGGPHPPRAAEGSPHAPGGTQPAKEKPRPASVAGDTRPPSFAFPLPKAQLGPVRRFRSSDERRARQRRPDRAAGGCSGALSLRPSYWQTEGMGL